MCLPVMILSALSPRFCLTNIEGLNLMVMTSYSSRAALVGPAFRKLPRILV